VSQGKAERTGQGQPHKLIYGIVNLVPRESFAPRVEGTVREDSGHSVDLGYSVDLGHSGDLGHSVDCGRTPGGESGQERRGRRC
jgi:hypothetical protein